MKRFVLLLLAGLAWGLSPAAAQQSDLTVAEIWDQGYTAYNDGNMEGFLVAMVELERRRPHQLPMLYNVAAGYALTGRPELAMAKLEAIAAAGLYMNVERDEDFASLREHPRYEALLVAMDALMVPRGESDLVAEFDLRGVLPEGIAIDETSGAMFISSVQLGQIWRVGADGELAVFVAPDAHVGLGGILGMAVDNARGLLWATSSTPGQYSGPNRSTNPPSALFAFDLQSGAVRHYLPLEREVNFLGDVVIGPDGRVYASDSASPIIFRVSRDLSSLEPYYSNDQFTNFQGFDFDPDGRIYLADYVHGLILIDPATRQVIRLAVPDGTNLSGIDGLFYVDHTLIAIRNGLPPNRIVRFYLSADGTAIDRTEVLVNRHSAWDEPTLGQIVDGRLIYNAASGWGNFTAEGELVAGATLAPIRIMSVELD